MPPVRFTLDEFVEFEETWLPLNNIANDRNNLLFWGVYLIAKGEPEIPLVENGTINFFNNICYIGSASSRTSRIYDRLYTHTRELTGLTPMSEGRPLNQLRIHLENNIDNLYYIYGRIADRRKHASKYIESEMLLSFRNQNIDELHPGGRLPEGNAQN